MKKIALALVLALPFSVSAATIAIVDSGSDFKHKDLAPQYQVNEKETAENKVDDDANGYIDDVYGFNLFEKNGEVIDYSYLEKLKPSMADIHKFFEIQVRLLDKTASDNDKMWMKAIKTDEIFMKNLQIFGNFAHGTHVAGISAGFSSSVEMENRPFALKIIPTEVKLPFSVMYSTSDSFRTLVNSAKTGIPVSLRVLGLELGLRFLAKQQTKVFGEIGKYVNARGADVANGSFGTGYAQLHTIVEMLYNMIIKEDERDKDQVDELTRGYAQQILINAREMPLAAPKTLFVFAAGNDGANNDELPCSPANLREDNTITVAATLRNRELASFSNFGMRKVDVAAPGVGIHSLYPGDDHGLMSGTSQAAPYVTYVAAMVKNQNPALTPSQIKFLLMETVDAKEWLADKVKSSGFVNPDRAREAALLSKAMPLHEAIVAARSRVKDLKVEETPTKTEEEKSEQDIVIVPLVSPIN